MCVVERKTYIHSDGHREVVEKQRRCHNAPKNGLCQYVEQRNDTARVVEIRPSSSSRDSSSNADIVTTGRDGRARRYQTVSRRGSTRNSRASDRSPADSLSPPASIRPILKEVRPPAPSPPVVAGGYPSARRSETLSPTFPPDPTVTIGPGGTAVYDRPPSLEMPRAEINERSRSRPSSFSSTSADIDDEVLNAPPKRRVSFRERRPSNVTIDVDAASANIPTRSSPGLSNMSNQFATNMSRSDKGKSHARVDSGADDLRRRQQQAEDDRQARLENEKLAESDRRQRERIQKAEDAAEEARQRAAAIERERDDSSRERKDRERRQTEARREAEMERKIKAELAQVARERATADARREAAQYQPIRPSIPSPRPSSSRSPISARTMTPTTANSTTLSARTGPNPYGTAIVHNYPSARTSTRKDSISERGEQVIAREQARAAAERMNEALGGMNLAETAAVDDDDDTLVESSLRRTGSRRVRREGRSDRERERERELRKERERRLRDEGYY